MENVVYWWAKNGKRQISLTKVINSLHLDLEAV